MTEFLNHLETVAVLVFLVSFARHRDENRKARGDLSGWRSRERRP